MFNKFLTHFINTLSQPEIITSVILAFTVVPEDADTILNIPETSITSAGETTVFDLHD